ncbi:glycosyltransferase family 39 protein [Rufibacter roseolus]|uniref:glycosyltransferase family 39 protein n=1 Tax=Rufibacter roseolus TaxID=2817375 RepID=UPI001B30ECBA|nr:glycosyltransferase family 39 protein [Rufibacter roseolus]
MPQLFSLFQRTLSSPRFWFLAVIGFTLAYFFLAHEGFYYGDDYSYSLYAHQLLHGGFHFDDYSFCHRFMVFVPTALFYWLWGMNVYTTTFWPLLCTLGTLLLLYLTFRKTHPVATSWALVLLGLYYFQLNTVNYLYPDNILLFFTTACLLVLYKARNPFPTAKQEIFWGITFAGLNLLAFLTKETIVYSVPFYLCLLVVQVIKRENLRFWLAAGITGILLLAGYFLLYKIFSGDALQRFKDIATAGRADTGEEYFASRAASLLPRLTIGPLLFFVGSGLAFPVAFAITVLFSNRSGSLRLSHSLTFWALAALSMLLPIWFGSVSLDYYKPMPLLPRMFHPLLPAFCLVAGLALEQTWGKRSKFLLLTLLFGACALLSDQKMMVMYAPLALFFAGLFLWDRPWPHWLGLVAVAGVLAIRPVYFMLKPTVSYYFEQKEIVDQHLNHPQGKYMVLMDSVMLDRYEYFYGFDVPRNYTFQGYTDPAALKPQSVDTIFLLINNGVLEHPELMIRQREKDILPLFPSVKLLDKKGKVKLFVLPKDSLR